MSDTKKLSRAEACEQLAHRIWPNNLNANLSPTCATIWQGGEWREFDPFTSRDAAAELVAWIAEDRQLWSVFDYQVFRFCPERLDIDGGLDLVKMAFLATPEQITLAACASLGIEVE